MGMGGPGEATSAPACRFCNAELRLTMVDLGMSPLCESFLRADQIRTMEPFYPLHVFVCERCYLAQLEAFVPPEDIFTEYAYFSAYSTAWVEHAREYVEAMRERLQLGPADLVVELASNDGYLLQHFLGTGIPILGVDPAANVAEAAEARGVPTLVEFFGRELATRLAGDGRRASRVVAVDPRPGSPTLREWVGVELSAENWLALYVPEGCAHGFLTLVDDSEASCQMSGAHSPEAASGVRHDDPAFAIEWPGEIVVVNERDRSYADYAGPQASP
jgi:hypothetical protein